MSVRLQGAPIERARRIFFSVFPRLFVSSLLFAAMSTPAFAVVAPGTNTGAIPDGGSPNPTCGAPRDIDFAVSGASAPPTFVQVDFAMTHTWVGDLQAVLIAPDSTSFPVFGYVGRTSLGSFGDNSNLNGTYVFSDLNSGNIWATAASGADNFVTPSGNYRTQASGPFSPANPGPPFSSMTSAFAGVIDPNGNWTLRFLDCAAQDTGTVTAANLTLAPLAPTAAGVSLGGKAIDANGRGLGNVNVTVSGGNLENDISAITSPFGYYVLDGLPAGQTYIVSVSSKRAFFANSIQVVNLDDSLYDIDFIASDW